MSFVLPKSWSELTWQQLCDVWNAKQRYGGNADVARCAALLALTIGSRFKVSGFKVQERTGEQVYLLRPETGGSPMKPETYAVTPRQLSYYARQAMPWFDYPYGDPGEKEQNDDKGNIIRERREPVSGYVGPMRDALALPCDYISVSGSRIHEFKDGPWWRKLSPFNFQLSTKTFALPQVACNNLTWQQYRALQSIAPQLFQEGIDDSRAVHLQAQFLANCLASRSLALLDSSGRTMKLRPHWVYEYDADLAERLVGFWEKRLVSSSGASTLFHICFQVYQTAIAYYASAYPLLFSGDGKQDAMRDALQGEVGTINTIMKYAGYAEQQQVYDSNLPFVLDILNTMTKEAKEIEKMNSKIKSKR